MSSLQERSMDFERFRQARDKCWYHLQGLLWIHCSEHAVIKEDGLADKLTGKTAVTNGKDNTPSVTWREEMIEAGLKELKSGQIPKLFPSQ